MAILGRKPGAALAIVAMLMLPLAGAIGQTNPRQEYALKSVFLYNFCRFIEWPERAFSSADEPMVIAVIGEDRFGPMLEETVRGEMVRGRKIRVERYRRVSEIGNCHILFITASETSRLDQILAAVSDRSVLTVGETDAVLERGGMIALVADQNRVRLLVNPARLRAANLVASSKLLRVAEIKQ